MNGFKQLQLKAQALQSWLGSRLETLRQLRRERDVALAETAEIVRLAETRAADLLMAKNLAILEAHSAILGAQNQIAEGERRLAEGRLRLVEAGDMPEGADIVAGAKTADDARRLHWRLAMRRVQDGRTRRKRWELARLERRLAGKQEQAQRRLSLQPGDKEASAITYGALPTDYGSPDPQPKPEV